MIPWKEEYTSGEFSATDSSAKVQPSYPAQTAAASSLVTTRRCSKSALFPISATGTGGDFVVGVPAVVGGGVGGQIADWISASAWIAVEKELRSVME